MSTFTVVSVSKDESWNQHLQSQDFHSSPQPTFVGEVSTIDEQ